MRSAVLLAMTAALCSSLVGPALGAPCAVHGSEAGLARALEARGAPGDRDRARALWDSAEQGFARLGARLPERHRRPIPKT